MKLISITLIVSLTSLVSVFALENHEFDKRELFGSLESNGKHIIPVFSHTSNSGLNLLPRSESSSSSNKPSTKVIPITYHGGRVLTGPIKVYNIFYGTWTSAQMYLLNTLVMGMSASKYFNVEKTYYSSYYNSKKVYINGPITIGGYYNVPQTVYGTSLTDNTLASIVSYAINRARWTISNNAVYFINTAPNIKETSGFCTVYCAFHSTATVNGVTRVPFAFIGNPAGSQSCMNGCGPFNQKFSPNGNPGIDAMANLYAHELMEALSDPDGNAWYDMNGDENADKCAWTYGTTYTKNGYYFNEIIGGKYWLIQRNWNAKLQICQT